MQTWVWYLGLHKKCIFYIYQQMSKILCSKQSFVRSGTINLEYDSLKRFGILGRGWSQVSESYVSPSSAKAYHFIFTTTSVTPSFGPEGRRLGFPVRCLV